MAIVRLNELGLNNANIKKLDDRLSEPTGKTLQVYEVNCVLNGEDEYQMFKDIKDSAIDFEVLATDIVFKAKLENTSTSYSGHLDQSTEVHTSFSVVEIDPDLPEEHSIQTASTMILLETRLRVKAITSLLVDKGIFSMDEFSERYQKFWDEERETKAFQNYIFHGIHPYPDTEEEESKE